MCTNYQWSLLLVIVLNAVAVSCLKGCKLPVSRAQRIRGHSSITSGYSHLANTNEYRLINQRVHDQDTVRESHPLEPGYSSQFRLGNQDFSVLLDTGSSDFWVVSTDCTSDDCSSVARYSPQDSQSLVSSTTPFRLNYLLGSVTGYVAFETVSIGIYEIASQAFAIANYTADLGLSGTGDSGVLGLCFPTSASISDTTGKTLLENIFANLDEQQRFFAFKLGRQSGLTDPTSSLPSANSIPTSPTIASSLLQRGRPKHPWRYDYWKLCLKRFTINGTDFPLSPSLVPGAPHPIGVLDTGTTLLLGPTVDVDAFWNAVGPASVVRKHPESDDDREYTLDPRDTNWQQRQTSDGWCVGGIQANDRVVSGDWLLGDIFLRNVYVVHHGANSTHPPLIGLTNVTDPQTALQRFRDDRGADITPPTALHIAQSRGSPGTSPLVLYTLSSAGGFVGGGIITYLVRLHLRRRSRSVR
ncbi:aspartic peptidase domain-containing protein [Schizophyllum amplum]|uniref:Aspartic peptidase domain-containing protein n=1 Tax=Schizophyllum amplum TaxID=97359 RepID=A0A550C3N5_9AGAR|nr:aspartic peptidase domain-containing protein [Auriculariopsis ampla]